MEVCIYAHIDGIDYQICNRPFKIGTDRHFCLNIFSRGVPLSSAEYAYNQTTVTCFRCCSDCHLAFFLDDGEVLFSPKFDVVHDIWVDHRKLNTGSTEDTDSRVEKLCG